MRCTCSGGIVKIAGQPVSPAAIWGFLIVRVSTFSSSLLYPDDTNGRISAGLVTSRSGNSLISIYVYT